MILFTTLGGIAIIGTITTLVVFLNGEPEEAAAAQPIQARAETGRSNPRVAGVCEWALAIAAADRFTLDKHSDYAELGRQLQGGDGDVRSRLLRGKDSSWFRQFAVTAAEIEGLNQEMARADQGSVMLHLSPRPEHEDKFIGSMDIAVSFEMASGVARVTGWSTRRMPGRIRQRVERQFHPEIGPSKDIEVVTPDSITEVPIAEPKPLEHLETTSPELRLAIDTHIRTLRDIDGSARSFSIAWRALIRIGTPAIPRLLNALYEIPLDSKDNLIRLRRVLVVLQKMTGMHFTFDHAALGADPFAGTTQEARKLALRSWFGWWTNKFDEYVEAALKAAREADKADPNRDKQSPGLRPKRR